MGNRCSIGTADEGGVFFDLLLPLDAKELDLRPASEGVEGLKIENENNE